MFQIAVAQKLVVCGLSLLFHMTVSKTFPVEYNIDDQFRATASFPTKIVYLYLSLMAARPKYYFAWTLGKRIEGKGRECSFDKFYNRRLKELV